jgi:hypothetical protein
MARIRAENRERVNLFSKNQKNRTPHHARAGCACVCAGVVAGAKPSHHHRTALSICFLILERGVWCVVCGGVQRELVSLLFLCSSWSMLFIY